MSLEFQRSTYYDRVNKIIDSLVLKNSPSDNEIIKNRFLYEVMNYEYKRDSINKYYNGLRFVMTIGSILLPAILSIGQMDPAKLPKNFDTITYWTSWSLSLTITACNGFLQLFSLDKNYIAYSLVVEQLKTEGWQYFQLSGKYENAQNHGQAFKQFCKSVEGVKRKQIEQEYNGKGEDKKNKFNFSEELNNTLPKQYQPKQIEGPKTNPSSTNIPSTTPPNPLSTLLDVGDSVADLKQSLKGVSGILDETTDVAKGVALELVDRSLETMEEGNPIGNKPSDNKSKGSE
ncbi:DUF4231 domain-containing protein [bacterium]|nr:DUF4231 domain-containing protein [bacterium]